MQKIVSKNTAVSFHSTLRQWYAGHTRSFPWVGEKDPYKVWLSEIILQQTRVQQGLPYYENILAQYPTIDALAKAEDQTVFRLWQGLGYYNRCKNMLAAAQMVCNVFEGHFPESYEDILKLPGIGPYTAAAIASFAFGLPYAVLDGNVERLLARYFDIDIPVNTGPGKAHFQTLAGQLLDKLHPAQHNQAIMDFGATVCLPKQPLCHQCPFQSGCGAYKKGKINLLPVKKPKNPVRQRYLHYVVFLYKNQVFIHKRSGKGIWQNLHEFVLFEADRSYSEKKLLQTSLFKRNITKNDLFKTQYSQPFLHKLTHQNLTIHFLLVSLKKEPELPKDYFPVRLPETDSFAFPKPLVQYLQEMGEKD